MKLATTTSDFTYFGGHRYSTEEAMRYIKQAGFKYLDYGFSYGNPEAVFTDDWKKFITGIKNLAKELDMEFVQAHAPMARSISAPIDDDNDEFVKELIKSVHGAHFKKVLGSINTANHPFFGDEGAEGGDLRLFGNAETQGENRRVECRMVRSGGVLRESALPHLFAQLFSDGGGTGGIFL